MEFFQRLDQLKGAILHSFLSSNEDSWTELQLTELKNNIEEWGQKSSDLGSDLEIAFRTCFEDYEVMFTSDTEDVEKSKAVSFIKFTIEFALLFPNISNAFGKIPFLLIEDLLEFQTIKYCKKIWKIIELLVEKITHPNLFSKGKFVVLKTCNSLLRKLSKSYDTEVESCLF
jgi:hypothetical protein